LPPIERRRLAKRLSKDSGKDWNRLFELVPAVAALTMIALIVSVHKSLSPPRVVTALLLLGFFAYLFFGEPFLRHRIQRWVMQKRVWEALPRYCDACGYDLTANTSGVCPECGRAIETERKPEGTASPVE
jgi:hypothetical protein